MSRWQDNFDNHRFQPVWKEIVLLSKNLKAPDQSVLIAVQELARLRKVVTYIDKIIYSCDYELIPEGTWDSFAEQVDQVDAQLKSFQNDLDINRFQIINKNLDNMLMYVRPYMVSESGAVKAAKSAFEEYARTIEESINSFSVTIGKEAELTSDYTNKAKKNIEEIDIFRQRVNTFEINLFGNQDGSGLSSESRINTLVKQLNGWYEEIEKYYNKLMLNDGSLESISYQIDFAKKNAVADSGSITGLKNEVNEIINELKDFHQEVFGKPDQVTGLLEGGLEAQIEQRFEDLNEFSQKQDKKYLEYDTQIEKLLTNATSAGLASAYETMKDSFKWPVIIYTILFCVSLLMIFVASLYFGLEKFSLTEGFIPKSVTTWSDLSILIIAKLPIVASAIFLALFSSKRLSESKRLQQEYAHKESLARSYLSFKKQIEDLGQDDDKLIVKLLETAIDAIGFNASSTLDKGHGDKTPIHEAIESVTSIAKSFKKDS